MILSTLSWLLLKVIQRFQAFGTHRGKVSRLIALGQAVLRFPARDPLLFGSRSDLVSCSSVCPSSSAVTAAMDATQRRSYRKFLQAPGAFAVARFRANL